MSHALRYRDWVRLAQAATAELSSSEADLFLSGTALQLWPELR